MKTIDYKLLKKQVSFRALLQRDGHQTERVGHRHRLCCPFHNDSTPSFYIHEDDTGGYCFGCGWSGDAFDYLRQHKKLSFKKAVKALQDTPKRPSTENIHIESKPKEDPAELTKSQQEQMKAASLKLAENTKLCEGIAACRGWEPETIQRLAEEGSLGIHKGALAFNYTSGLKVRDWPNRRFEWEFGRGGLWRVETIKATTTRILLCEGETDAISLVNIGMDQVEGTAVVALPSATTIPPGLGDVLKGKEVVICMDADDAGKKAEAKLFTLLSPVCSKLKTLKI
jgi:DNA primase